MNEQQLEKHIAETRLLMDTFGHLEVIAMSASFGATKVHVRNMPKQVTDKLQVGGIAYLNGVFTFHAGSLRVSWVATRKVADAVAHMTDTAAAGTRALAVADNTWRPESVQEAADAT